MPDSRADTEWEALGLALGMTVAAQEAGERTESMHAVLDRHRPLIEAALSVPLTDAPEPWPEPDADLVFVRRDSGGVFPDGTTNHPAIDFDTPAALSVPLTDGRLRAALANHRPLIREWLDAEDLADVLQASEGADTPSAQDTEDAAQHYRSRVAAALATPAPEPGWFDCGDPECGSCPRPREDEHHRMMKARRLATPAPEPGIDVERLAAALHRGLPFKCDPSIVADIAREYAALAIPSREKGEA